MPSYSRKVKIPKKTSQELYDVVAKDIDRFMSKSPISDFKIVRNAEDKIVEIQSKMFSAVLYCLDEELQLDAKLSLLATPFKSKIDEGIDRWLSKTFNLSA